MKKPKSTTHKTKVTVCCSGGIDSTALIHYYLYNGYSVRGVHFDYGQKPLEAEIKALNAIANYFDIKVDHVILRPNLRYSPSGECYGRNALFILSAISQLKTPARLISLGIHANSIYYDSSPIFVQQLQEILNGYFDGLVSLDVPFINFSKIDIVHYCVNHDIPINLTYSCDRSPTRPCGKCLSCTERARVLDELDQ